MWSSLQRLLAVLRMDMTDGPSIRFIRANDQWPQNRIHSHLEAGIKLMSRRRRIANSACRARLFRRTTPILNKIRPHMDKPHLAMWLSQVGG